MTDQSPLQRFPMEREDIDRLMTAFYARIRKHKVLGPIFARAIAPENGPEWKVHEEKIASFWRNAILMDRDYRGSPMQAHVTNGEVMPEHFPLWLEVFHETARDVLPPEKAASMSALAERIGQGLRWGLESVQERQGQSGPPNLR
ncbi:group III truncated hemoglobin [Maritimibacter sp. DP1N21-5]|uniref:group III truncated hemoglobin n=1 Tax=Maritimibacter sp. DP1N21-5 TaxID=2836867 RepID=UPI001C458452|nr:group III truncated hemoglobin [Maritimibacter sp. DP1N21-5]MBV7408445.1 group III truncated hemoglobin [Maritimibacter sp. DP1N21-5]